MLLIEGLRLKRSIKRIFNKYDVITYKQSITISLAVSGVSSSSTLSLYFFKSKYSATPSHLGVLIKSGLGVARKMAEEGEL